MTNFNEEIDELAAPEEEDEFQVGERYLVQTVTLWLFLGECSRVTDTHVYFRQASWVQELGSLHTYLNDPGTKPNHSQFLGDETPLRIPKNMIVWDTIVPAIPLENSPS